MKIQIFCLISQHFNVIQLNVAALNVVFKQCFLFQINLISTLNYDSAFLITNYNCNSSQIQ